MSFGINANPVYLCLAGRRLSRAPPDRTTAPGPPHTAAQGVIGQRTGAAVQLGDRGAWNALPGTVLLGPRDGGGS